MPFVRVALDRAGPSAASATSFSRKDADGPALLASLTTRPDLPPPSYVLHSSPGRVHVFWRVRRVRLWHRGNDAEAIGKRAAQRHGRDIVRADNQASWFRELQAPDAFTGHDRVLRPSAVFGADDFPRTRSVVPADNYIEEFQALLPSPDRAARAQRFLLAVEPAVAGQHGDLRTFRICCRVVRGFQLSDHEAILPFSPSGTHGVSPPGPSGSC